MKKLFATIALAVSALSLFAQDYIIIGKETKVFETPTTKGFAVTNRDNDEIILQPGMAFPVVENTQGWAKIEYTPGLKGYIQQLSEAKTIAKPSAIKPGKYNIANKPGAKLEIITDNTADSSSTLSAKDGAATYPGTAEGNILLFTDNFGNPAYTAVILDGATIIYSYDPKLTKLL